MKACSRCDSQKNLETDHIIPKSKGGTDEDENKRVLCQACHDFRHSRGSIISEIKKQQRLIGTVQFNTVKLTMWVFRLGVLEAFNTPELVKERGTFKSYWDVPETHYSRWYPQMKLKKENRVQAKGIIKLDSCFEKP